MTRGAPYVYIGIERSTGKTVILGRIVVKGGISNAMVWRLKNLQKRDDYYDVKLAPEGHADAQD